jgi:hypothetical protein
VDITAYRDEIKLKITGGLLDLEIPDSTIDAIINSALREMQRYIAITNIMTIPYSRCIDLSGKKINAVVRVFRAKGYASDVGEGASSLEAVADPMYATQWQLLSGTGNLYKFSDYAYNYAAWNTMLQIRNTTSTDLVFRYDKPSEKLYINTSSDTPSTITIEYVPRYDNVSEITSDYWIDVLSKLSLALTKVAVGRIRTRFQQSNALWTQDGEQLLNEGNSELEALRTALKEDSQLCYPLD